MRRHPRGGASKRVASRGTRGALDEYDCLALQGVGGRHHHLGPQLVQMFVGDGAKMVRDAFKLAAPTWLVLWAILHTVTVVTVH